MTPAARRGLSAILVPALIVVALPLLTWVTLRVVRSDDEDNGRTPAASAEPGVSHVHGLGLNPADDSLYVATHYGTFRIPDEGAAERVGDSYQDTMGFTVVGPDRFYGSGHPDLPGRQAGQPALLGLIESSDAGETWENLSLSGDVDFHGLAFAHDQIYGWDSTSGRFMVSRDGRTWETRSTAQLFGFGVDPDDPDHIVGASPDGLLNSRDGGRTWRAVDGPDAVVISWEEGADIWAAGPDGAVSRSGDGGASWQPTGSLPGAPQALLAQDGVLYAAAEEGEVTGIYRSDDGGRSWQLRYRDEL